MDSEAHSVNLDVRRKQEKAIYDKVAHRLIDVMAHQQEKKFVIERLKVLRAIEFIETTKLEEAKKWIRTLEKFFLRNAMSREEKSSSSCIFITIRGWRLVDFRKE